MKIPDENFSKMFSGSTLREFDLFSENFGSCHFNRHWKFRRMPFQSILEIQNGSFPRIKIKKNIPVFLTLNRLEILAHIVLEEASRGIITTLRSKQTIP